MIDQEEIHNKCLSKNPKDRIKALNQLRNNFSSLPDKQKAWNDLIKLTTYGKDNDLGCKIANKFDIFLDYEIIIKIQDNLSKISKIGKVLVYIFRALVKLGDLIRLVIDKNSYVRKNATFALVSIFPYVPDKQKAWDDLIKLSNDKNGRFVGTIASNALYSVLSQVPDKQQVLNDLVKLIKNETGGVRIVLRDAFNLAFIKVPDKQWVWEFLIELITKNDEIANMGARNNLRMIVTHRLESIFTQVPDKQKAWNDLIKLTSNKSSWVRKEAVSTLCSAFPHMPDRQKVLNDLVKSTSDQCSFERIEVACVLTKREIVFTLRSAFPHMSDKQKA